MRVTPRQLIMAGMLTLALSSGTFALQAHAEPFSTPTNKIAAGDGFEAAAKEHYGCGWDRNKCVRGRDQLAGLGYSTSPIYDDRHCTAPGCYNGFHFYYWK